MAGRCLGDRSDCVPTRSACCPSDSDGRRAENSASHRGNRKSPGLQPRRLVGANTVASPVGVGRLGAPASGASVVARASHHRSQATEPREVRPKVFRGSAIAGASDPFPRVARPRLNTLPRLAQATSPRPRHRDSQENQIRVRPPYGLRGRKAARRLRAAAFFPPFLWARCQRKGAPLEADRDSQWLND